ncbi:MAG: hypothetical protein R6W06_12560 [Prochlorococcaceae cyanobacterium]
MLLVLVFLASRLALFGKGLRPEQGHIINLWQNLDPALLQGDLARSLLFQHSQPPLWNAAIAGLIGIAGGHDARAMRLWLALAWAMSLAITLIIHYLVRRLTGRPWLAIGAGAFYVLFSSAYFYENYIFYMLPSAFLATLCGLGAYRSAVATGDGARLGWFCLALAGILGLILTWGLFHPLLIVPATALLMGCISGLPPRRKLHRSIVVASGLAVLLALVVPLKNQLLYGQFSSSSWIGINLMNVGMSVLPKDGPWRDCGFDAPITPAEIRLGSANTSPAVAAHPANAELYKRGSKEINANHIGFIGRSQHCMNTFREQLRTKPMPLLLNRVENALDTTARLSDDYWTIHNALKEGSTNFQAVQHRNAIYLRLPWWTSRPYPWMSGRRYLLPVLALIALLVLLPWQWWRMYRNGSLPPGWSNLLAITLLLVLWVVVMGNLANYAEQQRFRFTVEPLMLICLSVGLGLALPRPRRSPTTTSLP